MAKTVELQEGQKIYSEAQIDALFNKLEEYKTKSQEQQVLILNSIAFVDEIKKMLPFNNGSIDISRIDFGALMSGKLTKGLEPQFTKLQELIKQYTDKNPIVKNGTDQ